MATKRYKIWDKTSNVYTPSGERFTPEMWIDRYPIFEEEWAIPVVAVGSFNGGYCGELHQMMVVYSNAGAVFEDGLTNEEILEVIEAFEDEMNKPRTEPTAEERTATALEAMASGQTAESTAVMNALLGEDEV